MESLLPLLCLVFSLLIPITKSESNSFSVCNMTSGNYTRGGQYESNLKLVLSSITSDTKKTDFSNTTSGTKPNDVYGLLQCRGDISKQDCQSCKKSSASEIIKQCPFSKEAAIFYDDCWLHYAGYRFFSTESIAPTILYNEKDVPKPDLFNKQVKDVMSNLTSSAAVNPSKFAFGNFNGIYGFAQCTRDMSKIGCSRCLEAMTKSITDCCLGKQGVRAMSTTCFVRYELYSFFRSSASSPSVPPVGNSPSLSPSVSPGASSPSIPPVENSPSLSPSMSPGSSSPSVPPSMPPIADSPPVPPAANSPMPINTTTGNGAGERNKPKTIIIATLTPILITMLISII